MKNKTLFLILLVVFSTILIAGCTTQQPVTPTPTVTMTPSITTKPTVTITTSGVSEKEQACKNAGGNVTTMSCCNSTSDFPNLCLIGACGCAPGSSHQIKVCDCGTAKCFNGTACVAA
jgi:hypothetical protein